MLKLLAKELKLTASILSYVFIVFALMAFLPGYPILVGTFFCCLGISDGVHFIYPGSEKCISAYLTEWRRMADGHWTVYAICNSSGAYKTCKANL